MKEQIEEYFTEHERSNIGLIIKTRFGYVDRSYLDDMWDLGYYATWVARNTYDEERGRKYSTYQYQLVFNEIYKFVNAMYAQKRNMKQSIHIEDMLTALPDTTKLNKDDNQWVRQDVDFDYNLWIDKMKHCLDSRNLYIFNQLMLGYDQKEIGKALGCSHQAISQRVMKIKKILSEKGLL